MKLNEDNSVKFNFEEIDVIFKALNESHGIHINNDEKYQQPFNENEIDVLDDLSSFFWHFAVIERKRIEE